MAKQNGAVALSGKLGDIVFQNGKHGKRARTAPTLTAEQRKAKAILPQNQRTGKLNALAGTINTAVGHYAGALKKGDFYSTLLAIFRAEKTNEQTLLLRRLWALEISPRYPFEKACPKPKVDVKVSAASYTVNAQILMPTEEYRRGNSFSMEFIMLVFTNNSDACRHDVRYTAWMRLVDEDPGYVTLSFPRTKQDTDYLLACRALFGVNCKEDGYWSSAVMCILTGNAVTKSGLKMIAEADKVKAIVKPKMMEIAEKVRVEVRREK